MPEATISHADDRLLPEAAVAARYGVTRKTLGVWANTADLKFPPPIPINGRSYRRLSDLVEWEKWRARPANRAEQRERWRKAQSRFSAEAS